MSLCSPMDCNPPDSSVHEISQKEHWSGFHFLFQGIFQTWGSNPDFPHCTGRCFTIWTTGKPILECRDGLYSNVGKALSRTKEEVRLNAWYTEHLMGHVAHRVGCEDREGPQQSSSVGGPDSAHQPKSSGCKVGSLIPIKYCIKPTMCQGNSMGIQVWRAQCRPTPYSIHAWLWWGEREMSIINECFLKNLWECSWFTMLW